MVTSNEKVKTAFIKKDFIRFYGKIRYLKIFETIKLYIKTHFRKKKEDVIETSAEITGSVTGSLVGGLIAGVPGLIIGGITGPILTRVFKEVDKDYQRRSISPWERNRIKDAFNFAVIKLNSNLVKGQQIRTDIIEIKEKHRTDAEEILEGVFLNVQKEYEERKVRFLGNLFANICTNPTVSREHANQLINTVNNSSYRQLCILQLFQIKKLFDLTPLPNNKSTDNLWIEKGDVIIEIRDLQQKGLLRITTRLNDIEDNSAPILQDDISISDNGAFFCEMLSLNEINKEDLDQLKEVIK